MSLPGAGRRRSRGLSLAVLLLAACCSACAVSVAAPLKPGWQGVSDTRSAIEPHWVCPRGLCEAIADPHPSPNAMELAPVFAGKKPEGGGELGGYDPTDLRSAYAIPASGGAGQTIAVVEGFVYSKVAKDLAEYRSHYGLPPCTTASG